MEQEYTVIAEDTILKLVTKVNEYIRQGWKVQGGISSCFFESRDTSVDLYYQAMTKESE